MSARTTVSQELASTPGAGAAVVHPRAKGAPWEPMRLGHDPESAVARLQMARRVVMRIRMLAEGAEAMLEQLRGVEINREEMLELFGMVVEEAEALEPELFAAVIDAEAGNPAAAQGGAA
jgi:hypothetical protein